MTEIAQPVLLRHDEAGVARLTFNRPKSYNTLSHAMLDALAAEIDAIEMDPTIKVMVIAGQGPAFCAGHDLKEIAVDLNREAVGALFARCSRIMTKLTTIPQPAIALVDGIAAAAGCQLVAACDLALASDTSRFATSGVKYGLFCSTPMVALARVVPRKAALEMLFTGDFIDASEALRIGLVNRVVPSAGLEGALNELTARLLDKPADVLALGKRAFYAQSEMTVQMAYAFTTQTIVNNAMRENFAEGLAAFMEKRKPLWK